MFWPVHPHPLPDELLSSWLVRLAAANHCKVHSFFADFAGHQHGLWARDLDKLAPQDLLYYLERHTGQPLSRLDATTLRSFEGLVFEHLNPWGNTRWITPLGIYHRQRRQFGLQYCPQCLFEDGETPYYRKQWRLSFYTACDRHQRRLLDRCPRCQKPVMFFRRELGRRSTIHGGDIATCHHCHFDLRRAAFLSPEWLDWQSYQAYLSVLMFFELGWTTPAKPLAFSYSGLFFDGLAELVRIMASPRQSPTLRRFQARVIDAANLGFSVVPRSTHVDHLPVHDRHALIAHAFWLLHDWPHRLVNLARESGCSRSRLLPETAGYPFWLLQDLTDQLAI